MVGFFFAHTVSLLTDHLVITPKYRGKILIGEVAFVTEGIIRGTCAEMGIKIIEQDIETGVPTSQGLVRRSSLGSRLLPRFGWTGLGSGGEVYFIS